MIEKHILLVDGIWTGHHAVYLRTFARILLKAGYRISVLCPAPDEMMASLAGISATDTSRCKAFYFSDCMPTAWNFFPGRVKSAMICLSRWMHLRRAVEKIIPAAGKPDLIFFAWLDSYLSGYLPGRLIDWCVPFVWSGLYFHPRHLRPNSVRNAQKKFLFMPPENLIARSKYACCAAVLDAGIVYKLGAHLQGKPVFIFPDFADEVVADNGYSLVGKIKVAAKGRIIIGLLGSLERRKGLLTLLGIVREAVARDWYFVFAGDLVEKTFSQKELNEIKLFFDESRENCFHYFGIIPDDAKFNGLVNVCDVLFAAYEDFPHSSNLIIKAATYGKRLLVSSGGYMEEVVRQFDLGDVVPPGDIPAATHAIQKLMAEDFTYDTSHMHRYAISQSQDKLQQVLLSLVHTCLH